MLIASAPSASATLIAARTISSRDSAAARRGRWRPPRFMSSSTCRRRRAAWRSSARKARNGAQISSSSAATVTPSRPPALPRADTGEPIGVRARACVSYIVLLAYIARSSTPYDDDWRDGMGEIPAIETERLAKSFGSTQALSGLDLTVPQGGILGLLGPNGAGKTTAVRVLTTLLRPDAGRARVLGFDVVRQAAEVRHHIGLTGQYAALDDYLTGRANLIMIGQLGRLTRSQARRRADKLLARFELTEAAGRAVKTYSGGMRRRLDLAASLIGQPEVLFLDEPTTGLDPNSRAVMWEIIRELAADGTTLLLTTQYLDLAGQLVRLVEVLGGGGRHPGPAEGEGGRGPHRGPARARQRPGHSGGGRAGADHRAGGRRPGAAAGHGADAGPRRHHDRRRAGAGRGRGQGLGRDPAPLVPGRRVHDPHRAPGRPRARA